METLTARHRNFVLFKIVLVTEIHVTPVLSYEMCAKDNSLLYQPPNADGTLFAAL